MNEKQLDPWWKLCVVRSDLITGSIQKREFTADLGEFLEGRCAEIYRDPVKFFNYTYITRMMDILFRDILSILTKTDTKSPSIIQIDTPYGGGKTHTLISLFHLINSFKDLKDHLKLKEIYSSCNFNGNVKIACFVGTAPDVTGTIHTDTGIRTKTFLGEIFYQLGVYGLVKDLDAKGRAFGTTKIDECLQRVGPCIILMDEFLIYIAKMFSEKNNSEMGPIIENLLPSIQELFTAVANSESAVLIVTYPSRAEQIFSEYAQHYKDQLFAWLKTYEDVSNRTQTTEMVAAGDEEVGLILQTRLFEKTPSLKIKKSVGDAFFVYYKENLNHFPQFITAEDYKLKITKTYPFHPELLRIFHEQWGTLPKFQKTRHLLRILAEVIKEEFQKPEEERNQSPLIMPGHINLKNPKIQSTIFHVIDRNFEPVIAMDINKAENIDKIFDEKSRLGKGKYAVGLTTSIFLHSFSGSTANLSPRKHVVSIGANIPSCLISVIAPFYNAPFPDNDAGLPNIDDVISLTNKLLDSEIGLYYLHCTKDHRYYFDLMKNLTSFAAQEFKRLSGSLDDLYDEIKKIWQAKGINLKPIYFPSKPQDIPDSSDHLLIVLLNPRDFIVSSSPNFKYLQELAQNSAEKSRNTATGDRFRFYKNRLFFMAADERVWLRAEITYKWAKAWQITKKLAIFDRASRPERENADNQIKNYEEEYKSQIQFLHGFLYIYDNEGNIQTQPKDLKQYLMIKNISPLQRVYDYLTGQIDENEYFIWNMFRPELLVNNEKYFAAWPQFQDIISAQDLWDNFARNTTLPRLESKDVLKKCINGGLKKGLFGVAYKEVTSDSFYQVLLDSDELNPRKSLEDVYLYRIGTSIQILCKDCKKSFIFDPKRPVFLCNDCIQVTCSRCGKTVKAKEIFDKGCIKCKDLKICPNCEKFLKQSDLRLNNTKCIHCLDKEICPACKSPVTEDLLLPSISNPEYCNICKDWDICKGCKIRKPTKDLINDYCKKCKPPEPEKLNCRKCGKKFFPIELKEGLCTPCRTKQEEYIKSIYLEIDISNLNREASIFTDIQEAFASKGLDTSTSGRIILEIDIPAQKSIWSTEEEANQWINANFQTQSRKLKFKIVKGFKE